MDAHLEQSLKHLEQFEGSIPWMYRDTVGKVTVGVGVMLPNVEAALNLPFQLADRPATQAEIAADFARVDALPMGRAAHFYRSDSGPELSQPEIDSLLRNVLLSFESQLRARLTGYDTFPDSVKLALLDMAYNLGPTGLLNGYPRLIQAIEAGNWSQAAATCFRHGPGAARNQWTQSMFLQNVVKNVQGSVESRLKLLGYGMVGIGAALITRIKKSRRQ